MLKSRGITVWYLGANVPMKDVEYLANLKKPDYLYCHLTTVGQGFNFEKFLNHLYLRFKGTPAVISGQLTTSYGKKISAPVIFKKSFSEVMEFIAHL
jgi:methanogenic corrinoid protein MtbC1